MDPWTEDRVWDAVEAWRWVPPSSQRVMTDDYELFVTPGSFALTYAYGLSVRDPSRVETVLRDLRSQVTACGGTGVRVQLTPRSQPTDLPARLQECGYAPIEETEVLAWELRRTDGTPQLPSFRSADGVSAREIWSDVDYESYQNLTTAVFGDPRPDDKVRRAFAEAFQRRIQEQGHSDRFLAFEGDTPIGLAGMELVESVARLFGSGVLPQYRGRGAYGLLVRVRCEEALARGATLSLVVARVGTSGPILQRHGFRGAGTLRVYEARW
jgi:GNAT superfamily N-acetyltransferase